MRTINRSTVFKKDYKRAKSNLRHNSDLTELISMVITLLADDKPLPDKFRDHALVSNWSGYRECHIKPDLLLIYAQTEDNILRLARLGSHSELFR